MEDITDLAETIVEEKVEELKKLLSELSEWKNQTNSRISKINNEMMGLSKKFHDVAVSFITKEEKYDIKKLELKKKTL